MIQNWESCYDKLLFFVSYTSVPLIIDLFKCKQVLFEDAQ